MIISPAHGPLRGEVTVPGDKSVSHRSLLVGALAEGTTRVTGFLRSADCLSTMAVLRALGVCIEENGEEVLVRGAGLRGLKEPSAPLFCGNSGTTVRLLSGILSGQKGAFPLTGDRSLSARPMKRVITPLTAMGAEIVSEDGHLPMTVRGGKLSGIDYQSPVASAQVKSAVLLAGLFAGEPTSVTEPALSRDHTERMLRAFGADVRSEGRTARLIPGGRLTGREVRVPGDISSAAYFIGAALAVPGSEVLVKNVGVNPTRDGLLTVLSRMGADIKRLNEREESGEPVCDLLVKCGPLTGVTVDGEIIPKLIDELPLLAVLAALADGTTVIRGAAELRVKESDRIEAVAAALTAMGARCTALPDGWIIEGGSPLRGAVIDARGDHRIAMSFAVAALAARGDTSIPDEGCVAISYPGFFEDLSALR